MPTYPSRADGSARTSARDRRKNKSPDPLEALRRQEELAKNMEGGEQGGGLFSFPPPKADALKLSFTAR
jgi:hypothetical protein